ncbi:Dual specificity tyrosine-phosphorylation-regulated kinase 4 [Choanephora cucurbitarum]|uniref:dual-specificity kinase n=1 Tax=Choanephora cucurbitarum TaxID=101091 RepID=A0A1C7MYZ5_9FUNG|nr:Dual specificity tyrosine-phosphorylation-regulated kinase 4 [Choanephora cucurbitarum]
MESTGISQSGIYEAFAEVDRLENKKITLKKQLDARRKSTSTVETKKTTFASPRLSTVNTKKPTDRKPSLLLQSRRQTLSGALTSQPLRKQSIHQETGLIKLADTLRDTLAVERRLAQQELLNNERKPKQKTEMIDKRRPSMTKEKIRSLEPPVRRRTLSSGAQKPDTPQASPLKSTLIDQQRRHSVATTRTTTASPRRKKSLKGAESPFTSEDEVTPATPHISAFKRRSILAAATAKARQQQQQQQQHCPEIVGADEAVTMSSGDEKLNKTTRLRKKSLASEPDLLSRRMSRTESLKEGLPTSPSMMAARMSRRKSVVKQESPVNPAAKKSSTKENGNTTGDEQPAKKNGGRKRGKTLPGSLAKPPTVQSLQLPPMKIEPIKLTIPKTTTKRAPKSPSIKATVSTKKRLSVSSINTPTPHSPSSSSSTDVPPKKSLSTRKAKGQSHLGITTSRRASLKTPSSVNSKPSPVSASPRVRPRSTRRQSLGVLETNKTSSIRMESEPEQPPITRKLSSAYSNSRKNSLVEDMTADKDKGRHRAISLREKLEAMVAQHAIHQDDPKLRGRSPSHYHTAGPSTLATDYLAQKVARKSQSYDVDEKYAQLLSAEDRARPQRIKDTLMMWDKEMVEAIIPGMPKTPAIAIKFYGHHLSPFEQSEIQSYPEIYFVGQHAKKFQALTDNPALNYGYDDERGDYKTIISDHLAYRYEILEELGRGSFGQVVKCYDHKTASTVAVKLIRNKKRFYAQARTEVKILSDLSRWDPEDRHHNVKMTDSFVFRSHLCIAFECLSMNLYEFIKVNNFQGFHITLIKRFTIQLLRSLSLLARHGVVHCDLKPENILLKHPTKSTIKVIDFGSSCLEHQRVYTYIQSRFYRSPEIILGLDYNTAIDMWSLGCIIAELYTGVPIFPGENEQEQLACIMEIMGPPEQELIQQSERRHLFFDRRGEPRAVTNSRGKRRRAGTKTLSQALRCNDALFLDFIQQCLQWDPSKRLNPEQAFHHEWIAQSARPVTVRNSPVVTPTQVEEQA